MAKQPVQKILRVGLFQNQRLLEERLMRKPETVTIGHDYKKNTLVVPASNLPRTFSVFEHDKGRYVLQFTEKMEGKVSRDGSVETLADLRSKGIAKRQGAVYQLPLTPTMRGRVVIGEATVVFQFVTPPPMRPKPVLPASMRGGIINGMDRELALLIMLSALIQVGFVIFLELQDWPVVEDQEFRIPDRMARIMVPEDDDPPEPDEREEPSDDGDEPADDPEPVAEPEPTEERTPEEVAEERQAERLEVTETVEQTTIIGTLTAQSDDEEGVIARLVDNVGSISSEEAFEGATRVETGSGVRADRLGRGGSGSPDGTGEGGMAAGGELEIGTEGEVDTGSRGEQRVERVDVDMGMDTPDDMVGGTLDTQALLRALRQLSNNVEACYRDYLRTNPSASGTVRVLITITARGSRGVIQSADVAVDEVANGRVGQCIARELQSGRVRLPAPDDGDVQITVPYHFSPGG